MSSMVVKKAKIAKIRPAGQSRKKVKKMSDEITKNKMVGDKVGPTEKLVRKISSDKNEPKWMLEKRLEALRIYYEKEMPKWGPDLSGLDLKNITFYINPEIEEKNSWNELPDDIKNTFDKLGIPKAEREYLGGVGAQYDSGVVYHHLKKTLKDQGVIFENMDTALQNHPDLVKKYFKLIIKIFISYFFKPLVVIDIPKLFTRII